MTRNKTRCAMLGILSIKPSTGYDIKKYCDAVISGFWSENYGHIYPTLNALERDGAIKQSEPESDSRKIEYEITPKGKLELLQWLSEDTPTQPVRSEFMLKFLFSSQLPSARVIEMLEGYKRRTQGELDAYLARDEELKRDDGNISPTRARFLRATVLRGILSAQATLRWCDEVMRDMSEGEATEGT